MAILWFHSYLKGIASLLSEGGGGDSEEESVTLYLSPS